MSACRARGLNQKSNRRSTRLWCQALERRETPATFTVSNLNDSGAGSLRAAVTSANNAPGADTINFSVNGTITLTTGEMPIAGPLTIAGPGSSKLTVSGNHVSRVFNTA